MQYRWPVSDHGCLQWLHTSATLMTRPHAAFAQPGIVRVRTRLRSPPVGTHAPATDLRAMPEVGRAASQAQQRRRP